MSETPETPAQGGKPKAALLLLDIGSPKDAADVKPFLQRLYADPLVLPLPVGTEFQKVWARFVAFRRTAEVSQALASVGGTSPDRAALERLAAALCERLNASAPVALHFSPYVALRHAAPDIASVVEKLKADGVTRLVALSVRPFASDAGSRSALKELRERTEFAPALDVSMLDRFFASDAVRTAWAASVKGAWEALPPSARDGAQVLYVLDAQPIAGSVDPRLEPAREFAQAIHSATGLANEHALVYGCGTDPRASLGPDLDDALQKARAKKFTALVVAPIGSVCEGLGTAWELDAAFSSRAKTSGIEHLARVPAPASTAAMQDALATVVRAHLEQMQALRQTA